MYVQNMEQFVDEAKCTCSSDYKHDIGIILSQYELEELHHALTEWVAQNNIAKVGTMGRLNEEIRSFLDGYNDKDGSDEPEDDDICECEWCHEEFEYSELKHTLDGGLICPTCISAIRSRGEKVKIIEG